MTKPDWADLVSEWVDPDDWKPTKEEPYPFVTRWFGQSRDRSGVWIVDVTPFSLGAPVNTYIGEHGFHFWVRFTRCVNKRPDFKFRGKHGETIADLFRRIDAARRIGVDG